MKQDKVFTNKIIMIDNKKIKVEERNAGNGIYLSRKPSKP